MWPLALAALCAGGLAACGGGGGAGATTAPPQPRVFIDVVAALPTELDPASEQGPAFDILESSLAATLVRPAAPPLSAATLAAPGAVVGFLASGWHELAGGDYVFELRRGVRSAFGHELSAADVAFSFRRELAHSPSARFLAAAARIRLADPVSAIAPERVRVNVTAPSSLTLAVLADFRFAVLDSRAVRAHERAGDPDAHAWLAAHLAFYSPYELDGFEPGRRVLLRAVAHPWVPLAYARVAIEADAGPALRLADVAAAEASHTSALGGSAFAAAAATSGLLVRVLPSTQVSTLVPDERFRPFASALVRRALSLSLDRAAIARTAFGGFAAAAAEPLPAALALPDGVAAPTFAHDAALARRLLARAGYPRGFSFTLAGGSDAERGALSAELRAIGLRALPRAGGPADAQLLTVSAPVASAGLWIDSQYLRGAPGNIEGFDSPALDALGGALTSAQPAPALARALAILAAQTPVIPLVELPQQLVSRAQISGYAAYASEATYYDRLAPS
ncbi:MAG TPA: ABC transporter substrate-binding protein [Solirubrobacteraceae bacterium]|nr:ABC transporter substrate-binding protein [Solirubrobacteraceae bacterium]